MEHEWEWKDFSNTNLFKAVINVCKNCGICILNIENPSKDLPCPPWSSTVGGETTNTNRVCKAGEVKDLKMALELLNSVTECLNLGWNETAESQINLLKNHLLTLIQKHDGLDQD